MLGKVRRIVSFFDRSPTAAHILESEQEMFSLPKRQTPSRGIKMLPHCQDVRMEEEIIEVLKPLKPLKTLISTEATPSVSNWGDSPTVRQVKTTIRENLGDRYSTWCDFLHKYTALDPRFKILPCNVCHNRIYNSLITKRVSMEEQSLQ